MFINGTNRIIYIKWEEDFLPVGCLTSDSFSETVEMLDTTTRDNGGWKTAVPTMQSYNITFDGLIKQKLFLDQIDNNLTYQQIKILKRSRTLIEWKIESSTDIHISSGFGYITSLSDSANVDEFISFNATIQGQGLITDSTKELSFLQSTLQIEL
jgi:predicted secreted protein